jgi:hypothetical protein
LAKLDKLATEFGEQAFDQLLNALDRRFYETEDDLRERFYAFAQLNRWS